MLVPTLGLAPLLDAPACGGGTRVEPPPFGADMLTRLNPIGGPEGPTAATPPAACTPFGGDAAVEAAAGSVGSVAPCLTLPEEELVDSESG